MKAVGRQALLHHIVYTPRLRGDIAATLTELTRLLAGLQLSDDANAAITEQREALALIDEHAHARPASDAGLNPAGVVLKIRELVDDDATIACDIGSHYIYMARHFRGYQPRRVLFSDGQQTLGVALPWAMVASMVRPGTQVVSACQVPADTCSAPRNSRPPPAWACSFTHVILRDNAYDMVAFQEVAEVRAQHQAYNSATTTSPSAPAAVRRHRHPRSAASDDFDHASRTIAQRHRHHHHRRPRRLHPQHRALRPAPRPRPRLIGVSMRIALLATCLADALFPQAPSRQYNCSSG